MILFFKEALNDWILISAIYNAIHIERKNNANFNNVAIIDTGQIRTMNGNNPIVGVNENVIIIAHGNEWGDITEDVDVDADKDKKMNMELFYSLLISILPVGYGGTIEFRSCYAGRNSSELRNKYYVYESLVKRTYDLLHSDFRNVKVKGVKGPYVNYLDNNDYLHEICVNPQKFDEAEAIQEMIFYNRFAKTTIHPNNLQDLIHSSEQVANSTRNFFIQFEENLRNRKVLLTANIFNYWSEKVEGAE